MKSTTGFKSLGFTKEADHILVCTIYRKFSQKAVKEVLYSLVVCVVIDPAIWTVRTHECNRTQEGERVVSNCELCIKTVTGSEEI